MEELNALIEAEKKAASLFEEIENRGLIRAGISEKQLNNEVFDLAYELFGIKKYWHKRIVRAGKNTLLPYKENPPDLMIRDEEILFFDFGPVFEEWEADFGRTYVIGNHPKMLKMKDDIESAWNEGCQYYKDKPTMPASEFYHFTAALAKKYGWEFGNVHCGHLIGQFPHEMVLGDETDSYLHPENHLAMNSPNNMGANRFWIYEIHFVDKSLGFGGFFEQLLK